MQPLFEAARHEPLTTTPWRDEAARQAIHEIAADALAAYEGPAMWPAHALDDPETPRQRFAGLYFGAAGVVWALQW
ncbi:MAG: lanthionine synthetase, partial [Rubrivivax sp.]